jgi:hypothetical protein
MDQKKIESHNPKRLLLIGKNIDFPHKIRGETKAWNLRSIASAFPEFFFALGGGG